MRLLEALDQMRSAVDAAEDAILRGRLVDVARIRAAADALACAESHRLLSGPRSLSDALGERAPDPVEPVWGPAEGDD